MPMLFRNGKWVVYVVVGVLYGVRSTEYGNVSVACCAGAIFSANADAGVNKLYDDVTDVLRNEAFVLIYWHANPYVLFNQVCRYRRVWKLLRTHLRLQVDWLLDMTYCWHCSQPAATQCVRFSSHIISFHWFNFHLAYMKFALLRHHF